LIKATHHAVQMALLAPLGITFVAVISCRS
jgi:hypothetical protein